MVSGKDFGSFSFLALNVVEKFREANSAGGGDGHDRGYRESV